MENVYKLENEIFITKARWLAIFGIPIILWFYNYQMSADFVAVTILFIVYNTTMQYYFLKKTKITDYTFVLTLIDIGYFSFLYFHTLSITGLPQGYYFLILVMGIRHGMINYHWSILVSGFLYALTTIAGSYYYLQELVPIVILTQIIFFISFGVMSSFIFKTNFRQQIEKEDLISELQAANEQLCEYTAQVEELANTDPLTGLYNYRFFMKCLDVEIEKSKKFNSFMSIIIIDIDHFKDFNDTYGHPAGDQALKEVAVIFKANIRDNDVLCRYGGEEFLILLPSTSIEETFNFAERIRVAIQNHPVVIGDNQTVFITISGGVASYPLDASDQEQLLRIADQVLYSAKHKGRNMIHRRL